jgi:hypothetical protein
MRARLARSASGASARDVPLGRARAARALRGEAAAILPSKALPLAQIGNTLPMPYKFRPRSTSRPRSSGRRTGG